VLPPNSALFIPVRPIASKQLNSSTSIVTFSWPSGAVVTHPLWLREVPGSIPGSDKYLYVWFFVLLCFYFFCPKKHYLSQNVAISFAMLIYIAYLTFWKMCDLLLGYKDTDLASLIFTYIHVLPFRFIFEVLFVYISLLPGGQKISNQQWR